MGRGANWVKDSRKNSRKRAMLATKEEKCRKKGRKFIMVKVCDNPKTYKEVEVFE